MTATTPKYACQTYSWQMSFDRFHGRVEHMMDVTSQAGFTGFEPEITMLGDDWSAQKLNETAGRHHLQVAALTLVCDWAQPQESDDERGRADAAITAVKQLPGTVLNLVQHPGRDRTDLSTRQDAAFSCLAAVAARTQDAGVTAGFHANSPAGSVFRTPNDYARLTAELDSRLGFIPDFGHIAAGGVDWARLLEEIASRIVHVHIKDISTDGSWAPTGTGVLDIRGIIAALHELGYDNWIAFEDESLLAETDPDEAVLAAGRYIRDMLTT